MASQVSQMPIIFEIKELLDACIAYVAKSTQIILPIHWIYFTHALDDIWGEDLLAVISYSS